MMQSGNGGGHDVPVWEQFAADYQLKPAKPVLDGEPNYEDHPVNPWPKWDPATGYYRDYDVRKELYRSVFAGGCGVTYGHHAVWQFNQPEREPVNHTDRDWYHAIDRPGGSQVQFMRALMESHPCLERIPDQAMLVSDSGKVGEHVQATRDLNGRYAFVYCPSDRAVSVRLDVLLGEKVRASWYDPRSGKYLVIGEFHLQGSQTFTPPAAGPEWALVLDAA